MVQYEGGPAGLQVTMSPEYLYELADLADPAQLWRLRGFDQLDLPPEKRRQLDTGVALRRHAQHVAELNALIDSGKSLLITPLSTNSSATMAIDTPARHRKLIDERDGRCNVCGATGRQHYGNCKHAIRGVNMIVGPGE